MSNMAVGDDAAEMLGGSVSVLSALASTVQDGAKITLGIIRLFCGAMMLITAPFEMALRRNFGTLYINPVTWILNFLIVNMAAFIGAFYHLFPHRHGFIGVEVMVPVFWSLSIWHAKRLWYLAEHMHEEEDSEIDGDPWPFFLALPGGDRWRRVRVIYEPLLIIILGITFYIVHVFNPTLAAAFVIGGLALCCKELMTWILAWYATRVKLDARNRAKLFTDKVITSSNHPKTIGSMPIPESLTAEVL